MQSWASNVLLRPSEPNMQLNPVKVSRKTFKIFVGWCRDLLVFWLPKTKLICKLPCLWNLEWSLPALCVWEPVSPGKFTELQPTPQHLALGSQEMVVEGRDEGRERPRCSKMTVPGTLKSLPPLLDLGLKNKVHHQQSSFYSSSQQYRIKHALNMQ